MNVFHSYIIEFQKKAFKRTEKGGWGDLFTPNSYMVHFHFEKKEKKKKKKKFLKY